MSLPKCFGRTATIIGTEGDDTLSGTTESDVIVGLGGKDTITGEGRIDFICGGGGDDIISGGRGNDNISGDAGNSPDLPVGKRTQAPETHGTGNRLDQFLAVDAADLDKDGKAEIYVTSFPGDPYQPGERLFSLSSPSRMGSSRSRPRKSTGS